MRSVAVSLGMVLAVGCSVNREASTPRSVPKAATSRPAPVSPSPSSKPVESHQTNAIIKVISADVLLVSFNAAAADVSNAPTTVLKEEAVTQIAQRLNSVLEDAFLDVGFVVKDVRMEGDQMAVVTVAGLHAPKFNPIKDKAVSISTSRLYLPMSQEQARHILPGQILTVRARASYMPVDPVAQMFKPEKMYLHAYYKKAPAKSALIALHPVSFRITAN